MKKQPQTPNLKPRTNPMEVHHHPDVEKKGFKEYLLEGLMIFLAVTMGFFAEGIRENITDHAKEKEYILSMIEDAKTDTMNIRIAVGLNKKRKLDMDTLSMLCFNYDVSKNIDASLYQLARRSYNHPDFAYPTERTLAQLKNAGGMRLIRKKAAVDSILLYDDYTKKLAAQQANYEQFQYALINLATQVFNFQYYMRPPAPLHSTNVTLLSHDKIKLIEYGNRVSMYGGILSFYIVRLEELKEHAVNLINTLEKEYHLEKE